MTWYKHLPVHLLHLFLIVGDAKPLLHVLLVKLVDLFLQNKKKLVKVISYWKETGRSISCKKKRAIISYKKQLAGLLLKKRETGCSYILRMMSHLAADDFNAGHYMLKHLLVQFFTENRFLYIFGCHSIFKGHHLSITSEGQSVQYN